MTKNKFFDFISIEGGNLYTRQKMIALCEKRVRTSIIALNGGNPLSNKFNLERDITEILVWEGELEVLKNQIILLGISFLSDVILF